MGINNNKPINLKYLPKGWRANIALGGLAGLALAAALSSCDVKASQNYESLIKTEYQTR